MQNNFIFFAEDIYKNFLENICSVKFTKREVDIISTLLYLKNNKKIANFLSQLSQAINANSVQTHIANIMRKIGVSSRADIMDFVQKSGKHEWVKAYYCSLLIQKELLSCLTEISQIIKLRVDNITIIAYRSEAIEIPEENNKAISSDLMLAKYLQAYFDYMGLKVTLKQDEFFVSLELLQRVSIDRTYTIHILPHTAVVAKSNSNSPEPESQWAKYLKNSASRPRRQNVPRTILIACSRTILLLDSTGEEMPFDFIEVSQGYEGHLLVMDILEKLFSNVAARLPQIKSGFMVKYNNITGGMNNLPPISSQTDKEYEADEANATNINVNTDEADRADNRDACNIHAKKKYTILYTIFVVCIALSLVFFIAPMRLTTEVADAQILHEFDVSAKGVLLDRPNVIAMIDDKFREMDGSIKILALIGSGGSGKTTIAGLYAEQSQNNLAWTINSETTEALLMSFERIAKAIARAKGVNNALYAILEIKSPEKRHNEIIEFVMDHLTNTDKWLLIYDNVESITGIYKYLPKRNLKQYGDGRVIITTRNNAAKNHQNIDALVRMPELTPEEKRALFFKIMQTAPSSINPVKIHQIEECLEAIPPFPLDVSIAAHYLKTTQSDTTKYLEALYRGNDTMERLQNELLNDRGNYAKTRYSIVVTSLDNILKDNAAFAPLMLFISSLDSQNIPRSILDKCLDHTEIDSFIYKLKKYSIINNEDHPKEGMLSMHRSTQGIALSWLAAQQSPLESSELLTSLTNELRQSLLRATDEENNTGVELLSGHCEALLKNEAIYPARLRDSVQIALGIAYYNLGYDAKALSTLQKSLTRLSSDTLGAAEVLAHIGNVHRRLGDYQLSKEALVQSIKIYTTYNNNSPEMARALMFLGITYSLLLDYPKATECLEKSVSIYKAHADNDFGAAKAEVYLGTIYGKLGDYCKASNILTRSVEFYKTHANSDTSLGYARALAHLGVADRMLENYTKAQSELEESSKIYKNLRSENHIDVGWVSFQLGVTYNKLGYTKKAQSLLEQSLAIYNDHFGSDHTETARVITSLAEVYISQNRLDEAGELAQKTLAILNKQGYHQSYIALELLSDIFLAKTKVAINSGDTEQESLMKNVMLNYITESLAAARKGLPHDSEHIVRLNKKLEDMRAL